VVGAILDKVVGPDVVGMLRPQPDAGVVGPCRWRGGACIGLSMNRCKTDKRTKARTA
jgi:hypothetical protein